MRYNEESRVRKYIIKMVYILTQLKVLNIILPDVCIVCQALNTLLSKFGNLIATCNSQDEAWTVNDIIARCIAKEKKLKCERFQTTLFVSGKNNERKGKSFNFNAPKISQTRKPDQNKGVSGPTSVTKKTIKCFFRKNKGHKKFECPK